MKSIQQLPTYLLPAVLLSLFLFGCNSAVGLSSNETGKSGSTNSAIRLANKSSSSAESPSLLIFVTKNAWRGDLASAGRYPGNGLAGADALCQADTQCTPGATCKAIIATSERYPASEKSEWALLRNQVYYDPNGEYFGATNDSGFFESAAELFAQHFDGIAPHGAWTGFNSDGTPDSAKICSEWTVGKDGYNKNHYAKIGFSGQKASCSEYDKTTCQGCAITQYFCSSGGNNCDKRHLYCAEQLTLGNCDAPANPGVNWHRCDKSYSNLSNTDLTGANLTSSNLTHVDLTRANLTDTIVTNVNWTDTILIGANLTRTDLHAVNFSNKNLTNLNSSTKRNKK